MTVKKLIFNSAIVIAGLFCSIFLYFSPVPRPGLEWYWTVPGAGGIGVALLLSGAGHYRLNPAIYLMAAAAAVRYMLLPVCLTVSEGYTRWDRPGGSVCENQYAVMITLLELTAAVLAVRYYLPVTDRRIKEEKSLDESTVPLSVWCLVLGLLGWCLFRYDKFADDLHFFSLSSTATRGSLEQIALQVVKSYLYVRFLIYARKRYRKTGCIRFLLGALGMCLMNCGIFFGINRSLIVQTAIASITVLVFQFPEHRKGFVRVTVPLLVMMLLGISLLRHFGVRPGETNREMFDFRILSSTVESYFCGPFPITRSLYGAENYAPYGDLEGLAGEFARFFFPFLLPGLEPLREGLMQSETASAVFDRLTGGIGDICPMAGHCVWYFGPVPGAAADVLLVIWCARVLVRSSFRSVRCRSVELKFYETWLSVLFACSMCYSWTILLWSWSKFGMLFLMLSWVSRRVRIRIRRQLL